MQTLSKLKIWQKSWPEREKDFDLVWADKGAATVSRAGSCTWIKLHTDCIKMLWINWTQSSIFLCWFGIFYTQLKNMLTPWLTNMRYTSFIHVNISTIRIKYWGSEITSLFNASTEHPIINIVHLGIEDFDWWPTNRLWKSWWWWWRPLNLRKNLDSVAHY